MQGNSFTHASRCPPHQHSGADTRKIMYRVIAACVPGLLLATWFFGYGMLINIGQCCAWGVVMEMLMSRLRSGGWRSLPGDGSVLVAGVLLGITLPPGLHWSLVLAATALAVLLFKHGFGGIGANRFNPAMSGLAILLLAFPEDLNTWRLPWPPATVDLWLSPLHLDSLLVSLQFSFPFLSLTEADLGVLTEGSTMVTPLLECHQAGGTIQATALQDCMPQLSGIAGWELVSVGFLAGGLLILGLRVISWQIPLGVLLMLSLLSLFFYRADNLGPSESLLLHLFGGSTMLGAFFIATDPVTTATTARGKFLYGLLIGALIYGFRKWGNHFDGVAFAVLIGNFCVPLIDRVTLPATRRRPHRN